MTAATAVAPVVKRVRAYFAPVDRSAGQATIFDPAQSGRFDLDAPPAPWVDLGWISGFQRASTTSMAAIKRGAPAMSEVLTRSEVEATVRLLFHTWGKLQLSLAAGTQQMNVLLAEAGAVGAGSGGAAQPAMTLGPATTATVLDVGAANAAMFVPGVLVAVDLDCTSSTTGFVGSGIRGAYVRTPLADVDYLRRVTLNVERVASVTDGLVTLESPLPAGAPVPGMKASVVLGFCDREGSTFFQEWSALFVVEGQQGDRVLWHYPRLQSTSGLAEESASSPGAFERLHLQASFRALPVADACDGERVVCFRSYLPG
jgi:hypothetical protein